MPPLYYFMGFLLFLKHIIIPLQTGIINGLSVCGYYLSGVCTLEIMKKQI